MDTYNALYNQVGGNFAAANSRFRAGKYNGKAISSYSLLPVNAFNTSGYVYIKHPNRNYPPIRFERRQMVLIPVSSEAKTQFANWFFQSLSKGTRITPPVDEIVPRGSFEDLCVDLEARHQDATPPVKKKRRLVGAEDPSSDGEENTSDYDLAGFIVPDDVIEYED